VRATSARGLDTSERLSFGVKDWRPSRASFSDDSLEYFVCLGGQADKALSEITLVHRYTHASLAGDNLQREVGNVLREESSVADTFRCHG
jgi:hypothetical protein